MSKSKGFYTYYNRPPSPVSYQDSETKFVDQSEADMLGLQAQLDRFGIDGLQARFEAMKDKFGYADTRLLPSFIDLQNKIVEGNQYFDALPSEIRAEFNHKSEKFFDYIEKNPDKAVERGFISGNKGKELLRNIKEQSSQTSDKVEPEVVQKSEPVPVSDDKISA